MRSAQKPGRLKSVVNMLACFWCGELASEQILKLCDPKILLWNQHDLSGSSLFNNRNNKEGLWSVHYEIA